MPDIAGQRYYVTERARGYSSGFSKIYDEGRFINAVLYLLGSGRGAIVLIPDDDIAYNKTWTVITAPGSGTAPSCVTDHNDSTNCGWSVGASSSIDLLSVDLGSQMNGILRFVHYTTSAYLTVRLSVSNDNVTWTEIWSAYSTSFTETFVYINGYRYLKFSFRNTYSSAITGYLYSIEFYPDTILSISRSFSNVVKRVAVFVNNAYYQLLEVITGV